MSTTAYPNLVPPSAPPFGYSSNYPEYHLSNKSSDKSKSSNDEHYIPSPTTSKFMYTSSNSSCHMCNDTIDQKTDPVVIMPKCEHAFHFNCARPVLSMISEYCPKCEVASKIVDNEMKSIRSKNGEKNSVTTRKLKQKQQQNSNKTTTTTLSKQKPISNNNNNNNTKRREAQKKVVPEQQKKQQQQQKKQEEKEEEEEEEYQSSEKEDGHYTVNGTFVSSSTKEETKLVSTIIEERNDDDSSSEEEEDSHPHLGKMWMNAPLGVPIPKLW